MKIILFIFLFLQISSLTIHGIDVSKDQGNINWSLVTQTKFFAIIRAGYGNNIDTDWNTNYKNAKNTDIKVGAYWVCKASSVSEAKNEAKLFLKALSGKKLEWPVYYDIEEQSIFDDNLQDSIAKAFCDVLENSKYYCGIYSSADYLNAYFNDETKKNIQFGSHNGMLIDLFIKEYIMFGKKVLELLKVSKMKLI